MTAMPASDCVGWIVVGPHRMASGMVALVVRSGRRGGRNTREEMRAMFYDRELGGLVYLPFEGKVRAP